MWDMSRAKPPPTEAEICFQMEMGDYSRRISRFTSFRSCDVVSLRENKVWKYSQKTQGNTLGNWEKRGD